MEYSKNIIQFLRGYFMSQSAQSIQLPIDYFPENVVIYRFIDDDFIFIDFNKHAVKSENITKEEILGKKLLEIFPGVKEFGLFDLLLKVHKDGGEEELDMTFYEDDRISGWRHNSIRRLDNGDIIVFYKDLSKYKITEEKFKRQTFWLDEAQKITHIGNWFWDIKTNNIEWSDEVYRIFDEEPQSFEPTYERFLSYLQEHDREQLQKAVNDAITNHTTYKFEHMVLRLDNTECYVLESGSAQYDKNNEPISMIGSVLDITEKKNKEIDQTRRKELMDLSGTIIFYWQAKENWPVEYVSSNITQFGYSQEDFTSGKIHYSDIIHDEDKQRVHQEVLSHTKNNVNKFTQIYRVLTSEGEIRWIDDKTVIERDDEGNPVNYLGTIIDITEHKQIEDRLKSLGHILDHSMNEVFMFDADTFKFTYLNKEAQHHIGYSLQEMKEMTPVDIIPTYTVGMFATIIEPLLNGKKSSLIFETTHQCKNGEIYNVEIHLELMTISKKRQFIVTASDITERQKSLRKLKESEEKFKKIAENALVGIFIYKDNYVYVNEAFSNVTGYSVEELQKLKPWDIIEESYREEAGKIMQRRLKGEEFPKLYNDIKLVCKNSQVRTVRIISQTIKYEDEYAGIGTIMDITDIIEARGKLKLLGQAIEQTDEMIRITDKDAIITYVNEAFVAHTGYKAVELIGQSSSILKSGEHDKDFYQKLWNRVLSGKTYRGILINKKKDGHNYYEEQTITPIFDKNNNIKNFVVTSQDITQRVTMEEELKKLATIDSLTSIYNRYKINEEIDIEITRVSRYDESFSLVMLDIDYFKLVNDTYGHDIGDYILQELSSIVSRYIRASDRFGRWGGEEFMLILPQTNKEEALLTANKIREIIENYPFKHVEKLTVSIGVSIYDGVENKLDILKRVDNALYISKENGRNMVSYA